MNKNTAVVIIASFVIVVSLGFSAWNIFSAEQIQFREAKHEDFKFFDLMNNGQISMCNDLPFYADFKDIRIIMMYDGRNIGTFTISNIILDPTSEITAQGKFTSETFKESQYLSLHFDSMYYGVIPIRIDIERMKVATEISTNILGFIPFTITNEYPGLKFWKMMNNTDEEYNC